jgi:starch phosphorylase
MRASMASLTPTYSANRALREYTERYYIPAAKAFARRSSDGGQGAIQIAAWERRMRERWPSLRLGDVGVVTEGGHHRFEVSVYLDGVDADSVSVELYADGEMGSTPVRVAMARSAPLVGACGFVHVAEVSDTRPFSHFTPRLIPTHPGVAAPLEVPLITWARPRPHPRL